MKHFVLSIISSVFLFSCSISKSKESHKTKPLFEFTQHEESLLTQGKVSEPMRILQITNQADSLILRTASKPIDVTNNKQLANILAKRLLTTVNDPKNPGVGIAAPQVGILKKMIAVQRFDKADYPFEIYVNPTIRQYSKKTQFCLEGCLSIPDKMDTTKNRAYAILLEYEKLDGSKEIEMIEAFTAVIFQHEIDHLNGILFTDHLDIEIEEAEERKRKNNE